MALTKVTSGLISADASSVDLNIDAGTLYIDSTNNRVGIGNTSPSYGLDVSGTFQAAVAGGGFYTQADGGGFRYKQYLDVATAGCTITGESNRGALASISLYQTTTGADGGYIALRTSASGSTSPTERMRIASSGYVGIGTDNPAYPLSVRRAGGGGTYGVQVDNYGADPYLARAIFHYAIADISGEQTAHMFFTRTSGTTDSPRLTINSIGNVGIGTTSPAKTLEVNAGTNTEMRIGTTTNGSLQLGHFANGTFIGTNSGTPAAADLIRLGTGGTERMRITSGGFAKFSTTGSYHSGASSVVHQFEHNSDNSTILNLYHKGTSSPYGLAVLFSSAAPDNNSNYFFYGEDSAAARFIIYSDGDVLNHDNSYGQLSDEKLKQNITDAGSQWDDIKNLRVRNFKFKSDVEAYGDDAKTLIGLVAQEAELVSPHLVKNNPDLDEEKNDLGTVTKSVKYSVLYMKAIKALQEAMTRIEDLEARIQTLEGE